MKTNAIWTYAQAFIECHINDVSFDEFLEKHGFFAQYDSDDVKKFILGE